MVFHKSFDFSNNSGFFKRPSLARGYEGLRVEGTGLVASKATEALHDMQAFNAVMNNANQNTFAPGA